MAKDDDPTKIHAFFTIVGIAAGLVAGNMFHHYYTKVTGDPGHHTPAAAFIPLLMLGLGVWFTLWTIRKPMLSWFPVAIMFLCFGLGGLFL